MFNTHRKFQTFSNSPITELAKCLYRSNHQRGSVKRCAQKFCKENIYATVSFLIKLQTSGTGDFQVNFVKFLRTSFFFFTEHLRTTASNILGTGRAPPKMRVPSVSVRHQQKLLHHLENKIEFTKLIKFSQQIFHIYQLIITYRSKKKRMCHNNLFS